MHDAPACSVSFWRRSWAASSRNFCSRSFLAASERVRFWTSLSVGADAAGDPNGLLELGCISGSGAGAVAAAGEDAGVGASGLAREEGNLGLLPADGGAGRLPMLLLLLLLLLTRDDVGDAESSGPGAAAAAAATAAAAGGFLLAGGAGGAALDTGPPDETGMPRVGGGGAAFGTGRGPAAAGSSKP